MMMEYNLLHKGYNEGVTQQNIGNAFAMKALRYLEMNNSSFDWCIQNEAISEVGLTEDWRTILNMDDITHGLGS